VAGFAGVGRPALSIKGHADISPDRFTEPVTFRRYGSCKLIGGSRKAAQFRGPMRLPNRPGRRRAAVRANRPIHAVDGLPHAHGPWADRSRRRRSTTNPRQSRLLFSASLFGLRSCRRKYCCRRTERLAGPCLFFFAWRRGSSTRGQGTPGAIARAWRVRIPSIVCWGCRESLIAGVAPRHGT